MIHKNGLFCNHEPIDRPSPSDHCHPGVAITISQQSQPTMPPRVGTMIHCDTTDATSSGVPQWLPQA